MRNANIPMVVVARRYEYAPENQRPAHVNKRDWIWIGASLIAIIVLIFVLSSGLTSFGSDIQTGWIESNTADHWSAAYAFHNGYQQGTINTENLHTALFEIEIFEKVTV